jgi:hypothetical protein
MTRGSAKTTAIALGALSLTWLCAIAVLQGAKIKTRAEADPKFSFREVKTWAWHASGTGEVIMARSSKDDPAPVKKLVDPIITAAVARELGLVGLMPPAAGQQAAITVHYYLLVTVGMDAQVVGQFLPAVPLWGVPPFAGGTSSLDIITRGSLVLDAVSTSLGRVVWRGVAQTDVDESRTDAQREAIINDAVHDLVKKLPLKK